MKYFAKLIIFNKRELIQHYLNLKKVCHNLSNIHPIGEMIDTIYLLFLEKLIVIIKEEKQNRKNRKKKRYQSKRYNKKNFIIYYML